MTTFEPGDRVKFKELSGRVVDVPDNPNRVHVPVKFDGSILIHYLHRSEIYRVDYANVAQIGGSGLSGVWQPTGGRFEVMYHGHDQAGTFYLRERQE